MINKDIWKPHEGEKLVAHKETHNPYNPYAVMLMKGDIVIAHMPRKFSAACVLLLDEEDATVNPTGVHLCISFVRDFTCAVCF